MAAIGCSGSNDSTGTARDLAKQTSSASAIQRKRIDLTGNLSLTASNMVDGRNLVVRLKSDASTRTMSFPAGWRWLGSAAPANIAANKIAMLWPGVSAAAKPT